MTKGFRAAGIDRRTAAAFRAWRPPRLSAQRCRLPRKRRQQQPAADFRSLPVATRGR